MSSAILQVRGAPGASLKRRRAVARPEPLAALKAVLKVCRCYLSPVCYIDEAGEDRTGGQASKALADPSQRGAIPG